MSNCLFEAAYERVLLECECLPSFHAPRPETNGYNDTCKGPSLTCMKRILGLLGKLNTVSQARWFLERSSLHRKLLIPTICQSLKAALPYLNCLYRIHELQAKCSQ